MKCELCGGPVKVVGHTTKHYESTIQSLLDEKDREFVGRLRKLKPHVLGYCSGIKITSSVEVNQLIQKYTKEGEK